MMMYRARVRTLRASSASAAILATGLIVSPPSISRSEVTWSALTLPQCVDIGTANNLELRNMKLREEMAREGAISARSVYDSFLSFGATYTDSSIREPGAFSIGEKKVTDARAELGRHLSHGSSLSLSARQNRIEIGETENQRFEVPPYSSGMSLSLSQSLLRNAFGALDRAGVTYAEYGQAIAESIYSREKNLLTLWIAEAYWDLDAARASHAVGTWPRRARAAWARRTRT